MVYYRHAVDALSALTHGRMLDCEAVRPSLSLCAASRAEMITHAYVRYVDDRTCAVVSITDIKDFAPKDTEDFPVTPLLVSWTDENGATDFYRARVLLLAGKSCT